MATGLSSNWKKLQAKIKSEPSFKKPEKSEKPNPSKKPPKSSTGKRTCEDDAKQRPASKKQKPAPVPAPAKTKIRRRDRSHTAAMGVTQSSYIAETAPVGAGGQTSRAAAAVAAAASPSLALWADDHDISAEDLAAAYGLGQPRGGGEPYAMTLVALAREDRENAGQTAGLAVGKYLALDCEMVGVGENGRDDALARVSVVDFFGRQVYDTYVQMQRGQRVTDWRTAVSGITPRHLRLARPFADVRADVAALLRGDGAGNDSGKPRILVGHDVRHDLQVLDLSHPPRLIRDTAKFSGFKQYGNGPKPALRVLARTLLDVDIQQGAHSSVEDARVTMQLFRQHKSAFDMESANRFDDDGTGGATATKRKPQKKKKH